MFRRLCFLAALAAAVLATLACAGSNDKLSDVNRASESAVPNGAVGKDADTVAQQAVTVTDIVGRKVTVQTPIKSMILSEGRILYVVAPLEPSDPFKRIAGWAEDLRTTDADAYEKYGEKFPRMAKIPIFGSAAKGEFSVEKAIDVKPDVVVLTYDSYVGARDTGLIEKLAAAGIPSVVIDFRQQPLENTVPSILTMGRLMGRQERAQELVDYYTEQINLVYSRIEKIQANKSNVRPNVFIYRAAGLADCCGTFGNGNMGVFVERAGGVNIGSKFLPGPFGTLNPEQVIASDPDVIIVTGSAWKNFEPGGGFVTLGYNTAATVSQTQLGELVDKTPGWSSLKAVKNGRTYAIWHQFYISPYHFVTIMQFAKWLYPEAFADVDPEAVFRDFHQKFLPISYSGTFWAALR